MFLKRKHGLKDKVENLTTSHEWRASLSDLVVETTHLKSDKFSHQTLKQKFILKSSN